LHEDEDYVRRIWKSPSLPSQREQNKHKEGGLSAFFFALNQSNVSAWGVIYRPENGLAVPEWPESHMALAGIDTGEKELAYPSETVRGELARILASPEFSATPRRRKLLQYLVEEMLAGRGGTIKGYTIGVSVLGRGVDFDPDADPIVRQEARSLRRDLDSYYVSAGRYDPLRIAIPKGHYRPEFTELDTGQPTLRKNLPDATGASGGEPVQPLLSDLKEHAAAAGRGKRRRKLWALGFAAALLSIIILLLSFYRYVGQQNQAAPDANLVVPAIMILPFNALNDDPTGALISGSMAGQIMTELLRFPDLRIYVPAAEKTPVDPAAEAGRLGIAYLVSGDVSTDAAEIRITGTLTEIGTGRVLWSEKYTRRIEPAHLLAIQNEIAAGIATALGQPFGVISTELVDRLKGRFGPSMPSFECVVQATEYRRTLNRSMHEDTLACLQEAVRVEPDYAEAWALLAYTYFFAATFDHVAPEDKGHNFEMAIEAANKALSLDPDNSTALKAISVTNHILGNFGVGEHYARLALDKNPHDPEVLAQLGWRLSIRGNFDEGIPLLERAIARTINAPGWYYHLIAVDRLMKGDGEGMLGAAQHSLTHPVGRSYSLLAMAHALLGNTGEARRALDRMAAVQPDYDPIESWRDHRATDDIVDAIGEAIHKAGWPENVN
jgi:TolB-like protein